MSRAKDREKKKDGIERRIKEGGGKEEIGRLPSRAKKKKKLENSMNHASDSETKKRGIGKEDKGRRSEGGEKKAAIEGKKHRKVYEPCEGQREKEGGIERRSKEGAGM